LEQVVVPFQRAFTNFTSELGLSIFKTLNHNRPEFIIPSTDVVTVKPAVINVEEVTVPIFRPQRKHKPANQSDVDKKFEKLVDLVDRENMVENPSMPRN
jgi:hypothetical protein